MAKRFIRRWQPIYDRVTYVQAGQLEMPFFVVPKGQAAKSLSDTNMKTTSVLPQGKAHATHALRIIPAPNVKIADWQKVMLDAILVLNLDNEDILELPAIAFSAGCGINAMSNITAASTEYQVNHGTPSAKQIQSLGQEPIEWDNEGLLRVSLKWPALQTIDVDTKIWVFLDGYLTKGLPKT